MEKVTGYDGSGNIRKLERYGRTGASTYGKIDDLVYTYSGNKVTSIKDTGSAAYSSDFRFSNGTNTSYAFTYDAAGRMTSDASKGITSITWNVLGLPQTVTFSSGAVINYSYAADGTKLREARTASGNTTTTDYTGNLVLENGTRSRLLFDGGYMSLSDNAYHYFLTDHLGSVRVVANASGTAEEYNHYYPLGGPIAQYSSSTSLQPIKFQGKEWGAGKGLDLYDFGARRYDSATGRWISQDLLAEKYYSHSPYAFCLNNPILFSDPQGDSVVVDRFGFIDSVLGDDKKVYFKDDADQFVYLGELGGEINIDFIYSNMLERNERKARYRTVSMFYFLVKNKGAWDLKQNRNTIWGYPGSSSTKFLFNGQVMSSEDVGNHHFGVVLKGNGVFSERVGLIGAGIAQMIGGTSKPDWDKNEITIHQLYSSIDATPMIHIDWKEPYGDDPQDQYWIKQGYMYWNQHFER